MTQLRQDKCSPGLGAKESARRAAEQTATALYWEPHFRSADEDGADMGRRIARRVRPLFLLSKP